MPTDPHAPFVVRVLASAVDGRLRFRLAARGTMLVPLPVNSWDLGRVGSGVPELVGQYRCLAKYVHDCYHATDVELSDSLAVVDRARVVYDDILALFSAKEREADLLLRPKPAHVHSGY